MVNRFLRSGQDIIKPLVVDRLAEGYTSSWAFTVCQIPHTVLRAYMQYPCGRTDGQSPWSTSVPPGSDFFQRGPTANEKPVGGVQNTSDHEGGSPSCLSRSVYRTRDLCGQAGNTNRWAQGETQPRILRQRPGRAPNLGGRYPLHKTIEPARSGPQAARSPPLRAHTGHPRDVVGAQIQDHEVHKELQRFNPEGGEVGGLADRAQGTPAGGGEQAARHPTPTRGG